MFINTKEGGTSISHTGKLIPFLVSLHVKCSRSDVASPAALLFDYTGVGRQVLTLGGSYYSVLIALVLLPPLISCTITLGDDECIFGEKQHINRVAFMGNI